MRERRVDLHDLKSRLTEHIRDVEAGATTIVVTDHGRHVARIVPETDSLEQRLGMLKQIGALPWSGRRLGVAKPDVRLRGGASAGRGTPTLAAYPSAELHNQGRASVRRGGRRGGQAAERNGVLAGYRRNRRQWSGRS